MSLAGSVTAWIHELKTGDVAAAERLWDRYFHRLVALARSRVTAAARAAHDEEDIALSALASLCQGAPEGRFPQLADRDNLWPLLVVLTLRKATDAHRRATREKRGGGRAAVAGQSPADVRDLLSREPSPEVAAIMNEACCRLMQTLDEQQRPIAMLKLEGYTNAEIAARLGCGVRTVERRLELIRRIWEAEPG